MSRQNLHKQRKSRREKEIDQDFVLQLVKRERQLQPRIGTRKLQVILQDDLEDAGISIGRDKMFKLLRGADLLVKPLPKRPYTTNSKHSLPVFKNLIADIETTAANHVWVSDITYIRLEEGYEYLSLIMDLHSRKIVGYHSGDSLSASGCMKALNQALKDLPEGVYPIHHSDRGCQYCSHEYVKRLRERDLSISMTEENHCAENSNAERLNGTLKQEYGLRNRFRSRSQVRRAVDQAVFLYNNRRPHKSIKNRYPSEVHRQAA